MRMSSGEVLILCRNYAGLQKRVSLGALDNEFDDLHLCDTDN